MVERHITEIARVGAALAIQALFQRTTSCARIVGDGIFEETHLAHVLAPSSLRVALQLLELRNRAFAGRQHQTRHCDRWHWEYRSKRWIINRARSRHALAVAIAQIARTELYRREAPKPAHVLHDHWIVQPVAVFQIRLHLRDAARVGHLPALHR